MVLAGTNERETCPYHFSLRLFTMVRRSSCGPITCWILAQTSSLVAWSLYKMSSILQNNCCLQQLVGQPAHRCGHTLDWMIVRDDSVIIDILDVINTALSDHRKVFCSLSLRKPQRVEQQVTARNLRRIDPTRFQTDVSQVASSLAECPDCELLEELNASLLRTVLDRHAPLVTRTVTARPSAPWITEEVKATDAICVRQKEVAF